jgi:alginate O-acetyltransferase complex protein AlgJ
MPEPIASTTPQVITPTHELTPRELQAREQVGHTEVAPGLATVLAVLFCLMIALPPVVELLRLRHGGNTSPLATTTVTTGRRRDPNPGGSLYRLMARNAAALAWIRAFEDGLDQDNWLSSALRPATQLLLAAVAGVGNEKVYLGHDRWLFFRPAVDHLTGPGFLTEPYLRARRQAGNEFQAAPVPDPLPAVRRFHQDLAQRGIRLVVMPTPVKAAIHPEKLSTRMHGPRRDPPRNPSFARFLTELKEQGISVYNPTAALQRYRDSSGQAAFLATDTHWSPGAMDAVARDLAAWIRDHVSLPPARPFSERVTSVAHNTGDLTALLDLPEHQTLYPPEEVACEQVVTTGGQFWRPDSGAPVLLLGDSFTNIYSLPTMGWGGVAGLTEQLSHHLGLGVDRISRNDAGASATRRILAQDLARGRDRLAGKAVVVWQFAARELSFGTWPVIPLALGEPQPGSFFVPEPHTTLRLEASVVDVAPVPRPGHVPYRDHVVMVHLTDLVRDGESPDNGHTEAVAFVLSMRDGVLTPAAHVRPGDRVRVRLRPWTDVEDEYGGLNRSELDNDELLFQEPCWLETITVENDR